ncbi:MAG TPA: hypothetical protein VFJ99_06405 [Solirubrobacterales bacterium]|nr:hypothetical protein [Solirubrobacterales bacterium]
MRLRFAPTPQAAGKARSEMIAFSESVDPDCLAALKSVVGELVALSVKSRHADPIALDVQLDRGYIRGVLVDRGAGARALEGRDATPDRAIARRIIEAMVLDWGATPSGSALWFRIPTRSCA